MSNALDFAGSKTFKKQPVCSKGWGPCGYACLPHTKKNCKAALDGQVKSLAEWLERSAKLSSNTKAIALTPKLSLVRGEPRAGSKINKQLDNEALALLQEAIRLKEVDSKAYSDSRMIWANIRRATMVEPETVRAVKDKNGAFQSMAQVRKLEDGMVVHYLATAPWNIKPDDPRHMKGAGSQMMEEIIKESLSSGGKGRVKLTALPGALGFYEKIGFIQKGTYGDLVEMELSPKAAKNFLEKRGVTDFEQSTDDFNQELEDLELLANGAFCAIARSELLEEEDAIDPGSRLNDKSSNG